MTCIEFEALLQAFLDEGAFDDEVDGLRAHRETCAACRESWDRARLLADAIVAWREDLPDVDLVDSTLAAHFAAFPEARTVDPGPEIHRVVPSCVMPSRVMPSRVNPNSAPKARRTIAAIVSALALVVVAAVLTRKEGAAPEVAIGPKVTIGPEVAIGKRTKETRQQSRAVPAALPPAEEPNERPDQADVAYGPLARTAAGAIEEFAWMMLPARPMPVGPNDTDEESGSPRSLLEGWQRQLRPIGQSVGDTFDFLREVGRAPDDRRT